MKGLKVRKIRAIIPKKMQPRRAGYFGIALLVLFSVLSYSLFVKPAPKAKAATVGSTSDSTATTDVFQKKVVVTNVGEMVAFFNTGTQSVTGIAYATSTDNGATWSAATQVDGGTNNDDFSVAIDGSNDIYLAYSVPIASPSGGTRFRLLTYSAGSWTIGSAKTVDTNSGSPTFFRYTEATITVLANGSLVLVDYEAASGFLSSSTSSNAGTSWSFGSSYSMNNGHSNIVAEGNSDWLVIDGILYADVGGTGNFSQAASVSPLGTNFSITYGLDSLGILYNDSSGVEYVSYNIATGALSAVTAISSGASDVVGSIITDSQNFWAVYQSFVGANSYNVVYKRFNGTSWDGSSTALTADNLNNVGINGPERIPNTANVPVIWTVGTASPFTIKSSVFSTVGTVTDTGNQTGTLSGSLTGSSGDTVAKCGVWYYNTVNIVAGMTIKVCSSNGQVGGSLEIHANTVTIAGSVDGAGRGMPGGMSIVASGGLGGTGPLGGVATAGGTGVAGSSLAGATGAGSFAGSGGGAGTSSAGGASGAATDTVGGTGGTGSTTTAGTTGALAGYLGSGINGDSSTNESLALGSGGGSGGSGGSGAGGGGGASTANTCAAGGVGGNGAPGGVGGKGGNGGASIKIYSGGTLTVSGSILNTGQASNSGGSGASGTTGGVGGGSANTC
jgi:hypothetical protein